MNVERGNLIYQMPDDIFYTQQKEGLHFLRIYFGVTCMLFLFLIYTIIVDVMFFIPIVIIILLGCIFMTFEQNSKVVKQRFELYDKGFIRIGNKSRFVEFENIDNIEFTAWGGNCQMKLKNGEEVDVNIYMKDIEGYILFCNAIRKQNPGLKLPDLDIIKKWSIAWQNYIDKKISKKDQKKVFAKMRYINKDFGID